LTNTPRNVHSTERRYRSRAARGGLIAGVALAVWGLHRVYASRAAKADPPQGKHHTPPKPTTMPAESSPTTNPDS